MSFRGGRGGRGRGRGGYGGSSFGLAKQVPYDYFPELQDGVMLPDVEDIKDVTALDRWNRSLLKYWKSSPYYLEGKTEKHKNDVEIERYSDRFRAKRSKRNPLSYHLKLTRENFPQELLEGTNRVQYDQSKVRWNPDSSDASSFLDKIDKKYKDHFKELESEKKKAKDDESEEENGEDIVEESSSEEGDDYDLVIDGDDDEDDFNMPEDNNHEDFD